MSYLTRPSQIISNLYIYILMKFLACTFTFIPTDSTLTILRSKDKY